MSEERRTVLRYRCPLLPSAVVGPRLLAAAVRDLSLRGVGLLVTQPLEPGAVVPVELPNRAWNCNHLKLLRIIHATPQPDERWLVGSVFVHALSDEELQALVN